MSLSEVSSRSSSVANPVESRHKALSAYLFDASQVSDRHLVVEEVSRPLCDAPKLISGTQPIDDGNYIFDQAERAAFLTVEPKAEAILRPYVGSEEYINGTERWIMCPKDASPKELRPISTTVSTVNAKVVS